MTVISPQQDRAYVTVVANTKGGAGKSTIATNIAAFHALNGHSVLLVDTDAQKTSLCWDAARGQNEIKPTVTTVHYANGRQMFDQVRGMLQRFDHIVIDCGGMDSPSMRFAMGLSDVVLVPFIPRTPDSWALDNLAHTIDEVYATKPDLRVMAFLNAADPAPMSEENADAIKTLADYPQLPYVNASLIRRKVYSDAMEMGLSVLETKVKNVKAVFEFNRLMRAVYGKGAAMEQEVVNG